MCTRCQDIEDRDGATMHQGCRIVEVVTTVGDGDGTYHGWDSEGSCHQDAPDSSELMDSSVSWLCS